jgi:hypothetical protein
MHFPISHKCLFIKAHCNAFGNWVVQAVVIGNWEASMQMLWSLILKLFMLHISTERSPCPRVASMDRLPQITGLGPLSSSSTKLWSSCRSILFFLLDLGKEVEVYYTMFISVRLVDTLLKPERRFERTTNLNMFFQTFFRNKIERRSQY